MIQPCLRPPHQHQHPRAIECMSIIALTAFQKMCLSVRLNPPFTTIPEKHPKTKTARIKTWQIQSSSLMVIPAKTHLETPLTRMLACLILLGCAATDHDPAAAYQAASIYSLEETYKACNISSIFLLLHKGKFLPLLQVQIRTIVMLWIPQTSGFTNGYKAMMMLSEWMSLMLANHNLTAQILAKTRFTFPFHRTTTTMVQFLQPQTFSHLLICRLSPQNPPKPSIGLSSQIPSNLDMEKSGTNQSLCGFITPFSSRRRKYLFKWLQVLLLSVVVYLAATLALSLFSFSVSHFYPLLQRIILT